VDFYQAFEPKAVYQGLPPVADQIEIWIDSLLSQWVNLGVFYQDHLIGHCALDTNREQAVSEYLIFISPGFQDQGIGTTLTRYAMDIARSSHCHQVWLTVQNSNLRAIKVYRKVGFHFTGPFEEEREMILLLDEKNK
jgi:ribosomal protein S18 acetylase RimI-like enzyme